MVARTGGATQSGQEPNTIVPSSLPVLRVFLSSPGDVREHREFVVKALLKLRARYVRDLSIDWYHWDMPGAQAPMSYAETPQDSISRYGCLPRDCDLTIVLLWSRIGTPLPADKLRRDGTRFESGTVWELEDALEGGKEAFVYRCTRKVSVDMDDPDKASKEHQYQQVKAFFEKGRAPDGSLSRSVSTFDSPETLADLIDDHVDQFIARWKTTLPNVSVRPVGDASSSTLVRENPDRDRLRKLLRLCDQDDWIQPIAQTVRQCMEEGSRYAIGCVLPGHHDRGHDDLMDRIRDPAIADHIGVLQSEEVALLRINVPLKYGSRQIFEQSLLYGLQKSAAELSGAKDLPDVVRRMRQFRRKVVIAYAYYDMDESSTAGDRKRPNPRQEDHLIQVVDEFLRTAPLEGEPPTFLLAIGLKYPCAPTDRAGWLRKSMSRWFSAETIDVPRWADDLRDRYQNARPPLLLMPPLPLIRKGDLDRWRDDRRVKEALDSTDLAVRLVASLDKLFGERDAWPLPKLCEALMKDLRL